MVTKKPSQIIFALAALLLIANSNADQRGSNNGAGVSQDDKTTRSALQSGSLHSLQGLIHKSSGFGGGRGQPKSKPHTAICRDGSYSNEQSLAIACIGKGGIAKQLQ